MNIGVWELLIYRNVASQKEKKRIYIHVDFFFILMDYLFI